MSPTALRINSLLNTAVELQNNLIVAQTRAESAETPINVVRCDISHGYRRYIYTLDNTLNITSPLNKVIVFDYN